MLALLVSFRPLAGLSCINLAGQYADAVARLFQFPSPRGVELHKPAATLGRLK